MKSLAQNMCEGVYNVRKQAEIANILISVLFAFNAPYLLGLCIIDF